MTRRRRTEGCCQCLESSLAASRAYHKHAEEEEEARKLIVLAMAMKQEEDAELVDQ
jgi:hypothetical protein